MVKLFLKEKDKTTAVQNLIILAESTHIQIIYIICCEVLKVKKVRSLRRHRIYAFVLWHRFFVRSFRERERNRALKARKSSHFGDLLEVLERD